MLQTRSEYYLVAVVNTVQGGNLVSVANSAGWVVAISNTSPLVQIQNSAGWVFAQSNTGNQTVTLLNSSALSTLIQNSAGWVVAVSNTSPFVQIQNSANWVFAQSNTANQSVTVLNSSRLVSTYDVTYAMDGTALVTMQYASINITNSTNTTIISAVSNSRIKVMSLFVVSQGTGLLTWQSGTGTGLTGPVYLAANVGYVLPFNQNGWFQTGVATLLNANLTTATSVAGCITYLTTS